MVIKWDLMVILIKRKQWILYIFFSMRNGKYMNIPIRNRCPFQKWSKLHGGVVGKILAN